MNKTILSWDVGIKNLAYCLILKKSNDEFEILDWNIINLSNDNQKCEYILRTKNQCSTNAKHLIYHKGKEQLFNTINGKCVCDKHKKKLMPTVEEYISNKNDMCKILNCKNKPCYKIMNIDKNYCWCIEHKKKCESFFNKISTKNITVKKCSKQPMQELSEKLYNKLDTIKQFQEVDEILIENQPSFKNPVMKTISMLLYGYFVMRCVIDKKINKHVEIKLISPSNKLKIDKITTEKILNKDKIKQTGGNTYKLTKKLGVKYCRALICKSDEEILNSFKKKDDLCDSFLQGFQYLFNPVPKILFDKLQLIDTEYNTHNTQ